MVFVPPENKALANISKILERRQERSRRDQVELRNLALQREEKEAEREFTIMKELADAGQLPDGVGNDALRLKNDVVRRSSGLQSLARAQHGGDNDDIQSALNSLGAAVSPPSTNAQGQPIPASGDPREVTRAVRDATPFLRDLREKEAERGITLDTVKAQEERAAKRAKAKEERDYKRELAKETRTVNRNIDTEIRKAKLASGNKRREVNNFRARELELQEILASLDERGLRDSPEAEQAATEMQDLIRLRENALTEGRDGFNVTFPGGGSVSTGKASVDKMKHAEQAAFDLSASVVNDIDRALSADPRNLGAVGGVVGAIQNFSGIVFDAKAMLAGDEFAPSVMKRVLSNAPDLSAFDAENATDLEVKSALKVIQVSIAYAWVRRNRGSGRIAQEELNKALALARVVGGGRASKDVRGTLREIRRQLTDGNRLLKDNAWRTLGYRVVEPTFGALPDASGPDAPVLPGGDGLGEAAESDLIQQLKEHRERAGGASP